MFVCAALLIWWDHRRVLKKTTHGKPHDSTTVKGRTLQLRDDLGKFLAEIGDCPVPQKLDGMSTVEHQNNVIREAVVFSSKIRHYYALHFKERAIRTFHECGLAGTTHDMFGIRASAEVGSKEGIKELIDDLNWMAKHVD